MRNALSIAAGACSEAAEEAVDQQVEVDQPEADRHRQHQHQDAPHPRVAPIEAPGEVERRMAQVPGGDQQLDQGADEDRDRIGVDLVLAVKPRLEDDQDEDDRQVPEQRRDREGAEAVVAVEDADDDAADSEQDQDREEDLGEGDGEVGDVLVEARREDRHDHRREEDEERGDRSQHHRHQQQHRRGEPERLLVGLLAEQFGEDRDEGRLQRRVGEQGADQVRDLEGDREGRDRAADPVVAGGDHFASEPGDARGGGGEREEGGRAGEPTGLRTGRGLGAEFLARVESLGLADADVGGKRRLVGLVRPLLGIGGVRCPGRLQACVDSVRGATEDVSVAIVRGRPEPARRLLGNLTWPT
jgi:hypothetical protein